MAKLNKHLKVVGDLKDRGRIKWTAMMLPEHVEMIRDWYEEDKQVDKPDLDEDELQLLQEELLIAMKRKCEVKLKSWKDKKIHYHIGTIEEMDFQSRSIVYEDPFGMHRLPIDELVAIRMIN